ncbi:nodulation protein NfeD [Gammaproteobacteria bacterium]|nr:nodulation protein NfeD [Gammaproteobacteria bacterium]
MDIIKLIRLLFITILSVTSYCKTVVSITIDSPITPPVLSLIESAIQQAENTNSEAVIVKLDTPGGLLTTTRDITQLLLNSKVPVITYVSPTGARAASAGTFILYASHVAAMAPSTHIGAATPVSIGNDGEQSDAMEQKIINDSLAYIQSLADYHNRNAEFAIDAVKNGASITADTAVNIGAVDFIASDIQAVLKKADGIAVRMQTNRQVLQTADAEIIVSETSLKDNILMILTEPTIAYLMLLAGIYGLLIEFLNPGSILPGVIGAICLLIASYSLQIIPINYAGIGLIVLGCTFLVVELFMPSFGLLGMAGIIAIIIGGFFIFQVPTWAAPDLWFMLGLLSIFTIGVILIARLSLKAHQNQPISGSEAIIGKTATVLNQHDNYYEVMLSGEVWLAYATNDLEIGQQVVVKDLNGLRLEVTSLEDKNV